MEKKTLTFRADNQILVGQNVPARFASDTVSYIEAVFDLGENWSGFDAVKAVWSTDFESVCTVLDSSGACVVPWEVLERVGDVCVNLVGSISENDSLTDRLTTYPAKAITVDANATVCGSETSPITPSQFDQFAAAVRADADRAEAGATAAAASASSAAASATSASGSATDASQSASGAAQSAQSASESADSAERSAQSASDSASDAEEAKQTILNMTATATTLPEGSEATVDYSNGVMAFGIPKGDTGARGAKGDTGETGATPQISIGTVETLEPDEDATATITGTAENPVLNLGLPKGDTGEVSLLELIANTKVDEKSDSVPYQMRTLSGVSSHESLRKIVGGTVAWNQLVPAMEQGNWVAENGVTISFDNDAIVVSSATVNNGAYAPISDGITNGHKYLCRFKAKAAQALSTVVVGGLSNTGITKVASVTENWQEFGYVAQCTKSDTVAKWYCYARNTAYSNLTVKDFAIFDLTQMFGSTIADYIYSLEQSQEGAGVAWFKKLFPKPYYAYNAGELMSVNASSHDMVGFNQWDEEWEAGLLNPDGTASATGNRTVSKNYIPVVAGTTYYMSWNGNGSIGRGAFYDADFNFISYYADFPLSVQLIEGNRYGSIIAIPSGASYMKFCMSTSYGATYKNDICINLSDPSRNGTYEPYTKHTYPLDSSLTLRGIPKLDASNNLYYDGDTYASNGTVTRKYGVYAIQASDVSLDTGAEQSYSNISYAQIQSLPNVLRSNAKQGIHSKFGVGFAGYPFDQSEFIGSMLVNPATNKFWFGFAKGTTEAQMKSALDGTTIVYELATPTTEEADPYTEIQSIESGGTEEFVGAEIPVGHESVYPRTLADTMPTSDGSYTLSLTVSGGKPSVEWEVNA